MSLRLITIVSIVFLFSCHQKPSQVEQLELDKMMIDIPIGLKKKKLDSMRISMEQLIKLNTEAHLLPDLSIKDLNDHELMLYEVLPEEKSLLVLLSENCGMSSILIEILPIVIDSLSRLNLDFNILPIIVDFEEDSLNPFLIQELLETNQHFLSNCKEAFNEVYILNQSEAKKINIAGFPTRYYLNRRLIEKVEFGSYLEPTPLLLDLKNYFE